MVGYGAPILRLIMASNSVKDTGDSHYRYMYA